jgi:hypothetical protein
MHNVAIGLGIVSWVALVFACAAALDKIAEARWH